MPYAARTASEVLTFPAEYAPRARTRRPPSAAIRILLVEDDASDALLTEVALDGVELEYDLCTLQDGAEVVPYLQGGPLPDMLLLDLSLPGMDGFGILSQLADWATGSERFRELPIVILTGDAHCAFLKHCHGLNIIAYLTKTLPAQPHPRYSGEGGAGEVRGLQAFFGEGSAGMRF